MPMTPAVALFMAQQYTKDTAIGLGAVKGASCTVKSTEYDDMGNSIVTFEWTANNGVTKEESTIVVPKGVKGDKGNGIKSFVVTDDNMVKITLDDNTVLPPVPIADADVSISTDSGNMIEQREDGLYVPQSGSADKISYSNENFSFTNVKDALNSILNKVYYVAPSINTFTCSPASGNREIGQRIDSITFNWTTNKDMVSQTLTGCTITKDVKSAIYSTPLTTNKTFILTVKDSENGSANKSLAFSFYPKVYYGAGDLADTYGSDYIVGLQKGDLKSSKSGTYTMSATNGKYGFIAMPTSYNFNGVPKIGGFDTELVDCGVISVTNASGYTQNYQLWRTGQPNLGSISMIVS